MPRATTSSRRRGIARGSRERRPAHRRHVDRGRLRPRSGGPGRGQPGCGSSSAQRPRRVKERAPPCAGHPLREDRGEAARRRYRDREWGIVLRRSAGTTCDAAQPVASAARRGVRFPAPASPHVRSREGRPRREAALPGGGVCVARAGASAATRPGRADGGAARAGVSRRARRCHHSRRPPRSKGWPARGLRPLGAVRGPPLGGLAHGTSRRAAWSRATSPATSPINAPPRRGRRAPPAASAPLRVGGGVRARAAWSSASSSSRRGAAAVASASRARRPQRAGAAVAPAARRVGRARRLRRQRPQRPLARRAGGSRARGVAPRGPRRRRPRAAGLGRDAPPCASAAAARRAARQAAPRLGGRDRRGLCGHLRFGVDRRATCSAAARTAVAAGPPPAPPPVPAQLGRARGVARLRVLRSASARASAASAGGRERVALPTPAARSSASTAVTSVARCCASSRARSAAAARLGLGPGRPSASRARADASRRRSASSVDSRGAARPARPRRPRVA